MIIIIISIIGFIALLAEEPGDLVEVVLEVLGPGGRLGEGAILLLLLIIIIVVVVIVVIVVVVVVVVRNNHNNNNAR